MQPIKSTNQIREGDHVIIDINNERQSCVKVKKSGKVKVGKAFVMLDTLIGEEFGSLYEVTGTPARLEKRKRICEIAGQDWNSIADIDRNNSNLEDKGTANQNLSMADIELLKAEGKTGDEIVAALTQNSATFQNKTQFSQEKYKKKKAKKYTTHVTAMRPTAQTLADFYFKKVPVKTGWLRPDSLAILLSLANVGANSRTLVVDGTGGLIAGATLEHTGGFGTLVNSYAGDRRPSSEIVSLFNLPEPVRKSSIQISLAALLQHHEKATKDKVAKLPSRGAEVQAEDASTAHPNKRICQGDDAQELEEYDPAQPGMVPAISSKTQEDGENMLVEQQSLNSNAEDCPQMTADIAIDTAPVTSEVTSADPPKAAGNSGEEQNIKFAQERAEKDAKLQDICQKGFQSCIVGYPTAEPNAIMQAVLPLLAPSASFAIFFPSLQPLAECMDELISRKAAIAMQLQESWMRHYQVLPGRTHPMMSTSGTGGYILSGIKIA